MDLGIAGRRAIVCGSSLGLGFACAKALAGEGVEVVINGRHRESLDAALRNIDGLAPGKVHAVVADVTTPEGRALLLQAMPRPDILVTNAGGPPAGAFRQFSHDDWLAALNANMLSALDLIRGVMDQMMEAGFGRIVNITSSAVKAPISGLDLSNGARSGLTGVVAGLARMTVRRNVTINNLLPGSFHTRRTEDYYSKMAALDPSAEMQDLIARDLEQSPAGRFGDPAEFGAACAFLCSTQAGYITAQNILLDGGAYPGTY